MIRRWVAFWDSREHPRSLALVRIALALTLLYDFMEMWAHGLVVPFLAPQEAGGWYDILGRNNVPALYQWLPPEAWVAHLHHGILVGSALGLLVGFFTRTNTLVLLLAWAQMQQTIPMSDRAIDLLCRDVLLILLFSGAGSWASLDARWSTGRFLPKDAEIGAWARYLLIAQLVVMYFTAGVQKVGLLWLPMGSFGALYAILQDPAIARMDFSWLRNQPFFFATQIGTLVTLLWQWAYPVVLLWYYFKNTPERPGRLRAFANRWHLHLVWVGVGAVFHLGLAGSMELGIFPWAMLALYPGFIDPETWKRWLPKEPA